jgi:hypothetical protein
MPHPIPARPSLLAALLVAALAAGPVPARADVVVTTDGLVLEGDATTAPDGAVTVVTDAGEVRLAAASVKSVTEGEGPRAAWKRASLALKPGDVEGRFRLALRCEAQGLLDLAKAEYEAILRADPDHAAARRALAYEKVGADWLPVDDARRRRGLVLYEGKWLLPAEAEAAARSAPPAAAAPKAEAASLVPVPDRVAAATALLTDGDPKVRVYACDAIASLGDESALRPLILSATRDQDPDVRRAAVVAATAFGHDDLAVPFVRALSSPHLGLVANAGRALAAIADPRSIVHVVKRISAHGGSGRSVVQTLTQVSYVRDYDVEIAQASNIANPQIGYLKEGNVLDIKVIDAAIDKTVVETVLLDTLNALEGTAFRSADEVKAWYAAHAKELPDFPEKPRSRRPKTYAARAGLLER